MADPIDIRRMDRADIPAVAGIHYDFFGVGEMHGHSLANLGPEFLADVFYTINLDNPHLVVDVATYRDEIIAFSVYATDWRKVSGTMLRRHPFAVARGVLGNIRRRGLQAVRHLIGNAVYLTQKVPEQVRDIPACYLLLGILEPYRTRRFRDETGRWVVGELWDRMERTLLESGCVEFWSAPGAHNEPINNLFRRMGATWVARAPIQGVVCNFFVKRLSPS